MIRNIIFIIVGVCIALLYRSYTATLISDYQLGIEYSEPETPQETNEIIKHVSEWSKSRESEHLTLDIINRNPVQVYWKKEMHNNKLVIRMKILTIDKVKTITFHEKYSSGVKGSHDKIMNREELVNDFSDETYGIIVEYTNGEIERIHVDDIGVRSSWKKFFNTN